MGCYYSCIICLKETLGCTVRPCLYCDSEICVKCWEELPPLSREMLLNEQRKITPHSAPIKEIKN